MKYNRKVLELFGSIDSFSEVAKKYGFEILKLKISDTIFDSSTMKKLIEYEPEIIWISPPCKCFSVAAIGKNWTKDGNKLYIPKTNQTVKAVEKMKELISIIKIINPRFWFIENPIGVLRKIIDDIFNRYDISYIRQSVTYCQYGDTRMKPTDIWTNYFTWEPRPMCKNGDSCHMSAPRGSRRGTQGMKNKIKSKIPEQLCKEIINAYINTLIENGEIIVI